MATTVTFDSSTTWTVPQGVTSVLVECWGGGASGRAGGASRAGGGGGGYASKTISVTPGASETINVGTGGAGALGNYIGANGLDTYFRNSSTVMAKGGITPAGNSTGGSGGGDFAGGGTSVGTFTAQGGFGGNVNGTAGGAGGGAGGSSGTAQYTSQGSNTTGGTAGTGGGNGGNGGLTTQNGANGSAPGGGGGGTGSAGGGLLFAGAGANGRIKVTYTIHQPAKVKNLSGGMQLMAGGFQ